MKTSTASTNTVLVRKCSVSRRKPPTEGPTKAPTEQEVKNMAETRPYVETSLRKPRRRIESLRASMKAQTNFADMPKPMRTRASTTRGSEGASGSQGSGPSR